VGEFRLLGEFPLQKQCPNKTPSDVAMLFSGINPRRRECICRLFGTRPYGQWRHGRDERCGLL